MEPAASLPQCSRASQVTSWAKDRWLGLCTAAIALGLLYGWVRYGYVEGDTWTLLKGTEGLRECLANGGRPCPAAGKFPLLQLVPALVLRELGMAPYYVGRSFSTLNTLGFAAAVVLMGFTLARRHAALGLATIMVLLSGYVMHFASRSFSEMPAAVLAIALAWSWLEGRTPWVGVAAFLLGLSKETAFPFEALLGVTCAVSRWPGTPVRELWHRERPRFLALGGGMALAAALAAGLNVYRFGSPLNAMYLEEATWGPTAAVQLRDFAGLWVAPNGGVLFFWPAFAALLVALPILMRGSPTRDLRPWAGAVLLLLLLTASLARWWAPFGWWCWGPRFLVPWAPALLLVLAFAYAEPLERTLVAALASPARVVLFTAALTLLALPHVSSVFRGNNIIWDMFHFRGGCYGQEHEASRVAYYRCLELQAWSDPSPLARGYREVIHPFVRFRALLMIALMALLGVRLNRALRREELHPSTRP